MCKRVRACGRPESVSAGSACVGQDIKVIRANEEAESAPLAHSGNMR